MSLKNINGVLIDLASPISLLSFLILLLIMTLPLGAEEIEIQLNANGSEILANYDEENELLIFRGIPYAEPPVGNLRWKSPVPIELKSQIDARSFKPACMQDTYITDWYHDVIDSFNEDKSLFSKGERFWFFVSLLNNASRKIN